MNKNILGYLSNYNMPQISESHRYNEIDGLVFAIFSFAPQGPDVRRFRGSFSIDPIGKTMGEISKMLIDVDNNDLLNIRFGFSKNGDYGRHLRFFSHIAKNNRYKDIKVVNFIYNNNEFCQFSAFTFKIGRGEYLIAYRGTDDSLEGWYESIKIFQQDLPSRQLALNYLQEEMDKHKGIFRLVGHSKGGHLALSAAIMSDIEHKLNIRSIINFDGPGFSKEFIAKYYKSILLIQHKTYRFSPTDALVSSVLFGQNILYYKKNMRYIRPYGLQTPPNGHLYFNWTIDDMGKFKLKARSNLSVLFQNTAARIHHLYSPKDLDYIFDQLYTQAADIYKDSDNMVNRFDILTFFLGAAIKFLTIRPVR
ncbi:MAG: DUF2974 domain-containing protein [Defluviitaleaceae bacterium]|nr:DUF2974 domain-containing protein [Defluviitaleaceae bacterium]